MEMQPQKKNCFEYYTLCLLHTFLGLMTSANNIQFRSLWCDIWKCVGVVARISGVWSVLFSAALSCHPFFIFLLPSSSSKRNRSLEQPKHAMRTDFKSQLFKYCHNTSHYVWRHWFLDQLSTYVQHTYLVVTMHAKTGKSETFSPDREGEKKYIDKLRSCTDGKLWGRKWYVANTMHQ